MQLLQEYADGHSEEAFTALVSRHVNLVYSAAMRSVNNPTQAEEITQMVFVTLARKSRALRQDTVLSGWLYQTARLTASNFIRAETRRRRREQEARIQSAMNDPEPEAWTNVGPLLDEAMAQLNERDRDAIVLRFFEGKPLREVGGALGASEDAAKMRVNRALDKLRNFFHRRGITVPEAALAAAISENSLQAAPAGLAASVSAAASGAVQGSALAVSTLNLMKGAIHIMTPAKISVAVGACAAAIIALQYQQVSTQKQAVKHLQEQVARQEQAGRARQAELARLQEQNAFYAKTMAGMEQDAAKSRANAGAARDARKLLAAAGKKGNPFAEMFKDPDMLKAMRDQQASMIKMQYGPLIKQLNLSQEQTDKFYQILLDGASKGLEAMQSGKFNPDDAKSFKQSTEAELQTLLGDAGYAQYQDFTESIPDRTMLTLNQDNFADNPLSDTQQQQLLQAMKAARQSVTANNATDVSQTNPTDKMAATDQTLQRQEQINHNVFQQAAAFLSPDQLQSLATSQSNWIAMQKAMAPMVQKMFTNAPDDQ